ncbi:hypothetical protein Poli38472_007616 [Pythium oligandrum]|uniref:2-dehydropantoate 2-reductase n=1 Tax=Pythium oligandrum TaxID=41045 RepID=A0A8K1CQV9_PYTOL|nr:hypothetical protein Poli38472_007616 [Pythium oligandrum]|eukprot:TMW67944.1 hypothetical protein Poli38472_007616 [Pythium oligandrum]
MEPLRVGVVGLGAIGTIFFTHLARLAGVQTGFSVHALVKERHLKQVQDQKRVLLGDAQANEDAAIAIDLETSARGSLVAQNDASVQISTLESMDECPLDVVLVALKAYDSARTLQELKVSHSHRFRDDALFVLLQNGLVSLPDEVVTDSRWQFAHGVTYVGGRVESLGHVVGSGVASGMTYLAPICSEDGEPKLSKLNELLVASGLQSQLLSRQAMQTMVWKKLIVNAAINPIASVLNTTNGALATNEWSQECVRAIVHEAYEVAQQEGVDLHCTEEEMVGQVLATAVNTSTNVCSMLADLRRGARTEIDAITGQIVRLGSVHGIATPTNAFVLSLIKAMESNKHATHLQGL